MNINTGDNDVEIMVEVRMETTQAILVNDSVRDVWLPKSQVEIVEGSGKTYVQLPEWLALERGLI